MEYNFIAFMTNKQKKKTLSAILLTLMWMIKSKFLNSETSSKENICYVTDHWFKIQLR